MPGCVTVHLFRDHKSSHSGPHQNYFEVEAICENPNTAVGQNVMVEIVTGQCYYASTESAHFYTGWKSPSRMHIEEVRMSKSVDAGT